MKKRILTLMLLFVAATFAAKANPVDMSTIREVAVKFMNANAKTPLRSADDLQLVTTYRIDRGDAAFHIFNMSNGFVIVAADDCATPILGYSDEGQFDVENIPIQLQDYLQGFVEQIEYSIENHLVIDEKTVRQWELVRHTGRLTENRDGGIVEPLITTTWGQNYPYNMYAPYGSPSGCVATAMAQIMKYWEWPPQGIGEHSYQWNGQTLSANFGETTYDWNNMLDDYNDQFTQEQEEAVATLMWHCGVAVNMSYSSFSSGALSINVPKALKDYFNYADDMHLESRQVDGLWLSLLKTDLDLGCPVYYGGSYLNGTYAHAFVCDGYDVNDRFHFNFGWNGDSNGYFALNAISYQYNNVAVFNIHPNAIVPHQVTASANPSEGGTVTGAGIYGIGNICTLTAMTSEGYTFMYWTEDDEVVSYLAEYSFRVRKDRDLVAHFALPYHIEVASVPMEGGTVSGAGEYNYGSTCTLTATANEGYEFVGWRRANGSVASTATTYSFTVTESTTLTAVFAPLGGEQIVFADLNVKALCVANWDTDGDGELSYAEAVNVTSLGQVFRENVEITSFEELRYFTGLTSIDSYAFYGCRNLWGSLYIPNSVTSIGEFAFKNCNGFIGDLIIPNSVTSIGDQAFSGCSGLTSIKLPNSVASIGSYTFSDCQGLTSIELPDSVTSIGDHAFYFCSGLTSIEIPNSVASINQGTFYYCTGLTSIEIPGSVTSIGHSAFYYCTGLTSMTVLAEAPPTLGGDYVFKNVNKSIPVYVPCGSLEAYQNAGGWNEFTNMIGLCSGEVAVTINPSEGGTVTGTGYYNTGDLCVLTATSNPGFSFGNWTENGIVVSTDAVYSFPAHSTTIVVNFCPDGNIVFADANVKAICVSNWDTNGDSELSYAEAAAVTSLGEVFSYKSLISSFDELRYFIGLASIGNYAFSGCTSLTSIELPNSLASIGNYAFSGCSGLSSMTVFAENPPAIGNYAFSGVNKSITVCVPCGSMEVYQNATGWIEFTNIIGMCSGEVTVMVNPLEGGTVTGAGYYEGGDFCVLTATPNPGFSFGNWTENGVVVSTDSVFSFHAHTATIVANFKGIVFADANVRAICMANWDANGDGELSYLEAATVTSLGEVFAYNQSISSFDELQYFIGLTMIDNIAFEYCTGLTSIKIPNSVTSIGEWAFSCCTSLTSIEIPNSVTCICWYAFFGCTNLTSIEIPNSVTYIVHNPFDSCSALGQIIVDTGNTVYDSRGNCNAIINSSSNELIIGCKNTIIPSSVTSIGNQAFSGCSGLTSIEIPNSVTFIDGDAFLGCTSLTSIEIPSSVTSIGENPFNGCRGLEQIIVDSENTVYDSRGNCNAIIKSSTNELIIGCKNTIIPNSISSIGSYAFTGCTGMTSMTVLAETPPTLGGNYVFYNVNKSIPVYVPCGSLEAYQNAEGWNEFTNIQEVCSQQTVMLSEGWNWFATNVDITFDDLKSALLTALPETSITIKGKSGSTKYIVRTHTWNGTLDWDMMQMYKIEVPGDCEITLEGTPIIPADHPITILNGPNWIGYPLAEGMTVTAAFANFGAVNGDVIKSKSGSSRYWNGSWRPNGLTTLEPGQGYIFNSAATGDRTLVFPSGAK